MSNHQTDSTSGHASQRSCANAMEPPRSFPDLDASTDLYTSTASLHPFHHTPMVQTALNLCGDDLSPSTSFLSDLDPRESFADNDSYADLSQFTFPFDDFELPRSQVNTEPLSVGAMHTFNASFPPLVTPSHPTDPYPPSNSLVTPALPAGYHQSTPMMCPSPTSRSSPGLGGDPLAYPSVTSVRDDGAIATSLPLYLEGNVYSASTPRLQHGIVLAESMDRIGPGVAQEALRSHDGSWTRDVGSGQAGIDPNARKDIQGYFVPSLEDLEESRVVKEKNRHVFEWLTSSDVGGETGGFRERLRRNTLSASSRRRAHSTNDMFSHACERLGARIHALPVSRSALSLNVESHDQDADASQHGTCETSSIPGSPAAQIDIMSDQSTDARTPHMLRPADRMDPPRHVHPWDDCPQCMEQCDQRNQPDTSNAAIMKFRQRARDLETASLAVTVGSRRRQSASEVGSVWQSTALRDDVGAGAQPRESGEKGLTRVGSLRENLNNLRRHPSNLLKRKSGHAAHPAQRIAMASSRPTLSLDTSDNDSHTRSSSWGLAKSPRPDKSISPLMLAKNAFLRTKSRVDFPDKTPGLSELMRTHGGPPTLSLVTPANDSFTTSHQSLTGTEESNAGGDAASVNTSAFAAEPNLVMPNDATPIEQMFRSHVRALNPQIPPYLLERIVQEQMQRYKKLLVWADKRRTGVDGRLSKWQPKWQPSGMPMPPVPRMPAEFECPLCFKLKQFRKQSDWTTHVYEDLQPFTCTFSDCDTPMSFKRKHDWDRHENEQHRQSKRWACPRQGCGHVWHRQNNFVQHLVREHDVPEPKRRVELAAEVAVEDAKHALDAWKTGEDVFATPGDHSDTIWALVQDCQQSIPKDPKDEPCRFCGTVCTEWKDLRTHVARHLQQISLPIIALVANAEVSPDGNFDGVKTPRALESTVSSSAGPADHDWDVCTTSDHSGYDWDTASSAALNVTNTYPIRPYSLSAPASEMQGHVQLGISQDLYGPTSHCPLVAPSAGHGQEQEQEGQAPFQLPIEADWLDSDLAAYQVARNQWEQHGRPSQE